jgi:hypothetical protein
MRFRGPQALKDRWDEKAGLRGMRYAPKNRRARGAKKRRPAMKKISTVQTFRNEIFKEQKLTIGLEKSLAIQCDLAQADVAEEHQKAMRAFPVRGTPLLSPIAASFASPHIVAPCRNQK